MERVDGTTGRAGCAWCGRARGVMRRARRAGGEGDAARWMDGRIGDEISTRLGRASERIGAAGRDDATRAMGE